MLLLCALAPPAAADEGAPVRLGDGPPPGLAGSMTHLLDPERALTLPDARRAAQDGLFILTPNGAPNFGAIRDRVWLRIPLESIAPERRRWAVAFSMNFMQGIDIWLVRGSGAVETLMHQDEDSPFSSRPLPTDHLAARFELEPGERAALWIAYWSGGATNMPTRIVDGDGLVRLTAARAAINYAYYGMMAMLATVGVAAAGLTRQRVFLSFSAYAALLALYVAHMDGAAFHHLWPDAPRLNGFASLPLGALATAASALYARAFLRTDRRGPRRRDRTLLGFAGLCVALVPAAALVDTQLMKMTSTAIGSTAPLLFLVVALTGPREDLRQTRFFVAGWSGALLGGLAMAASTPLGLSLSRTAAFDIFRAVTLFEALMMACAIVDRYQQLRRAHEASLRAANAAMAEALALQARADQLDRRRQEALEAARRQGRRAAEAAHDLRQPIAALRMTIAGMTAGLGAGERGGSGAQGGPADLAERREAIARSFAYLEDVVARQLEPAAPGPAAGTRHDRTAEPPPATAPAPAPAPGAALSAVLGSLAEMFADEAAAAGACLRIVPCAARVEVDPLRLMRILSNLVSNAVKYGGGRVLVGCRRDGPGRLRIEVIDRGPGLSAQDFAALAAGGGRLARDAQGAEGHGLGLGIVAGLAAEAGLRLEIAPLRSSNGTRILLRDIRIS